MAEPFKQFAIVELLGHVRLAGLVTEEVLFGQALGRIDIPGSSPCVKCAAGHFPLTDRPCPECKGAGKIEHFTTQYFSGSSIYRLTPTTEEIARQVAASSQPTPVHAWELRQLPKPVNAEIESDYKDRDERKEY